MKNIQTTFVEIAIPFILYWIFVAPLYFFSQLKSSPITFFIFLPAGVKLVSILIFDWRGMVGVALGTFSRLASTEFSQPVVSWLFIAFSTTLSIYLVVRVVLKLMGIERDLSNLRYYQVLMLATITSIVNGFIFAYGVGWFTTVHMSKDLFHSSFITIMGNFTGNAVFVCGLMIIMRNKLMIKSFIARLKN